MIIVGDKGKYQKIIIIIIIGFSILTNIYLLQIPFILKSPILYVQEKNKNSTFTFLYSEDDIENNYCNSDKYELKKDKKNSINNFAYNFNLYCNKIYFKSIIKLSLYIGIIISFFILNSFPDKYGREKLLKYLTIFSLFIQLNLIFNFGIIHTIIIYILGGFLSYNYQMCSYIIFEYIRQDLKEYIFILLKSIFPIFGLLLWLFFYTINNWRILYIILFIINIIIVYITLKYFIESPVWLSIMGKRDELIENLNFIAEINNNLFIWKQYQQENKRKLYDLCVEEEIIMQNKTFSIIKILKLKSQRKKIIKMTILWFCTGTNFYMIYINLHELIGNFYSNLFFSYMGMLFGILLSGYLIKKFGRVLLMKIFSIIGFIDLILYIFVEDNIKCYILFFYMFNYSSLLYVLFIYTIELFPNHITYSCCGFLFFIGKISPFLNIIFYILSFFSLYFIIYIIIYIVGITLFFKLEETFNNNDFNNNLTDEEIGFLFELQDINNIKNNLDDKLIFFNYDV